MRYVITGLPRSRTFWLSQVLSYDKQKCLHDPLGKVSKVKDIPECDGIADTGAMFFYHKLIEHNPHVKWIVIERPLDEVAASIKRLGVIPFKLFEASARLHLLKQSATLVIPFDKINVCGELIWKTCEIPYDFSPHWWNLMCTENKQCALNTTTVPPLLLEA